MQQKWCYWICTVYDKYKQFFIFCFISYINIKSYSVNNCYLVCKVYKFFILKTSILIWCCNEMINATLGLSIVKKVKNLEAKLIKDALDGFLENHESVGLAREHSGD